MNKSIALTIPALLLHLGIALSQSTATPATTPDPQLVLQAENGDTNALFSLGVTDAVGKTPTNVIAAYVFLHVAAELGDSRALMPRYDVARLMVQQDLELAQRRAREFMRTNAGVAALLASRAAALAEVAEERQRERDFRRNLCFAMAVKEAPGRLIVTNVTQDADWNRVQYFAVEKVGKPRLVVDSQEKKNGELEWARVPWMDRVVMARLSELRLDVPLVEFRRGPHSVGVYDLDTGEAWESDDPLRLTTPAGKPIVVTRDTGIIRKPQLWFGRERTVGVTRFELFLIDSCGFSRRAADLLDVTDSSDFTKLAIPIAFLALYELDRFIKRRKASSKSLPLHAATPT